MSLFFRLLLLVVIPGTVAANAPACGPDPAGYSFVTEQTRNGELQRSVPWEWIPKDQRVLYVYPDRQIAEGWTVLTNGRVRLERAFLDAHRGISYEPADLLDIQAESNWQHLRQPVPESLLGQLNRTDSKGEGCDRIDIYEGRIGDTRYEIHWAVAGNYPQQFVSHQQGREVRQHLERLLSAADVEVRLAQMGAVDYMDYADVGDNEADPFVLQLIELGFVEHGESPERVAYPGHAHSGH